MLTAPNIYFSNTNLMGQTQTAQTVWEKTAFRLVNFKRVPKLLKTYNQLIKLTRQHLSESKTSVCIAMISANNQVKTQSQHSFKAHNMKALLNCKPNLKAHKKTHKSSDLAKLDFKVLGSPLLIDYEHTRIGLCRKQLLKSALGAISLHQIQAKNQAYLLNVLIYIQKQVFLMHYSELKQSAHLQSTPYTVICNLVRSRLNIFKLKAFRLKAARLTRTKLNCLSCLSKEKSGEKWIKVEKSG